MSSDLYIQCIDHAIRQNPILSKKEERELIAKAQKLDYDNMDSPESKEAICAQNKLIVSNLRWVIKLVHKHRTHSKSNARSTIEDLVSEGVKGFIRAIQLFDLSRDVRLTTYATWWIRQLMQRHSLNNYLVHVPQYQIQSTATIEYVRNQLTHKLGRNPTDDEMKSEIANEDAYVLSQKAMAAISDINELKDHSISTQSDININRLDLPTIEELLNASYLSNNERDVLRLRYGFGKDGRPKTLQEVGETIGLTRERIRQIERDAIRKIRSRYPKLLAS